MTRVYRHRRNSYKNKNKALPIEAMHAAGVSLVSLVIYIAIIIGSACLSGETPKWLGGLANLGYYASIGAFIFNIGQMRTKTEIKYRIICICISVVVLLIWTVTAILGMVK